MAKSKITTDLEKRLYKSTQKMGTFACFEVTIGFGGKERVDYMTVDTKNIVRCYEVKSSVADFRSKCKHTFIGNYNYFVMNNELYEKVKDEIPKGIGVHNGHEVIKRPIKQELKVSMEIILFSMVRSLSRDATKWVKLSQKDTCEKNKKEISRLKKTIKNMKDDHEEFVLIYNQFMRENRDIKKKWNEFQDKTYD